MKRLSTRVLMATFAVGLGLTTIVVSSVPSVAQGNIRTYARANRTNTKTVAQATVAPSAEPSAIAPAAAMPAAASPATSPATSPASKPAAETLLPSTDFGKPPSGEVPIIFNDRHVYARPDRLTQNRVLAAIVRGNTVLVPMRSMFEQMGATVSYNVKTKMVDVNKPGSDVKVTVGKPEVIINGESRPLDVAPEIYKGSVVVPLRVLSEGMGAYVQWVADKKLVVVRYVQAPVPSPPATLPPPETTPAPATPVATPSAAPAKALRTRSAFERFVVGDYIFSPKVYSALSPGNRGRQSFRIDGAIEFKLFNLPWMLEGDFRSYRYPHGANGSGMCQTVEPDQSCASAIGQQGAVYVPSFQARDDDFDGRFGLKIADPRIYIGVGYLFRNSNYEGGAFETQQHGLGGGIAKLPDLDEPFSVYGSVFYYPSVVTNSSQNLGNGAFGQVSYRVLKYNVGGTFNFGNSPLYLDFGYLGDRVNNKDNGYDSQHSGPYAGLGIHF